MSIENNFDHFSSIFEHRKYHIFSKFWLSEYIWPLFWFMRRNLSLNRLCFGDFKHFSSCKNPWVRREDDFFQFRLTQSNTQSQCQFLRESCSDFRFGFSGKTVASDRFIRTNSKKRDTHSSPRTYRASLTGVLWINSLWIQIIWNKSLVANSVVNKKVTIEFPSVKEC